MEKQNLNILPGGILPVVHCSQGDIGRQFQINLFSDNAPYVLDGTEDLTLDGKKADNNIFSYDLPATTGSTITISTEEQMTACAGDTVCEIRIFKGTTRIGTCNFILQVEEGPSNGTLSNSALQALDAIRAELQQAVEDAESYNTQSKSWAVGPNGTGSGTDTNNSKYYSEQSSNSATSSANSANASSSSATDSKNWAVGPSGSGSGTDTNNSKYYSQQSANSASDSLGYATNSQNSANASASSATDSKNWAVGPSGSGSGTDSNNAKYYSDQSSNSATNASNSANSASSSATDSKNWAVGPNGSGSGTDSNNSKYYAEQSANSATSASNSASDANDAKNAIENMTASATQLPEGSTPTVEKTTVGGVVNLEFGIPKGDTGDTGATGQDGVSPEVSIGTISGGHSVTITDAEHPSGQTFNVMDGEDGLGVPSGGTTGQVLAKASNADNDTEWITPSGGGGSDTPKKIELNSKLSSITFSGFSSVDGKYVWTDGEDIYYSSSSNQYVYDKSTKTWSNAPWRFSNTFYGYNVWTDGTDIYYSQGTQQYVFNKSTKTWSAVTWTGLTNFQGQHIWTDGIDIYYSYSSQHYVLDKSTRTWSTKTWTGLGYSYGGGEYMWSDGISIYNSYGSNQKVLDIATSTWSVVTWTGLTDFNGTDIWSDGTNIYYSDSNGNQYILDKETKTWTSKTWIGSTTFYGKGVWSDTENIYAYDEDNEESYIFGTKIYVKPKTI